MISQHNATLNEMMVLLIQDVLDSDAHLKKQTDPNLRKFWARMYTRAVFAMIEGSCENLCQQALVAEVNKLHQQILPGRLSVLAGKTYFVNEKGDIEAQEIRIRFLHHVLLALNSYAEAQEASYRTKKGGAEWDKIKAAASVRDRITHPKNLTSLEISEEEISNINFIFRWFLKEIASILNEKGCQISPMPMA